MRFSRVQTRERSVSLDFTSMCDMVFLLIIFFLTTSSMTQLSRAQLELPRQLGEDAPGSAAARQKPGLVVNLNARGEFIVDGLPTTRADLLAKLDAEIAKHGGDAMKIDVLIRADRRAPLSHLNTLADEMLTRGVRGWRLATEVPGGAPVGGATP